MCWSFWTVPLFYAEMGGQVADHGYLTSGTANLKVNQVKKKTPKASMFTPAPCWTAPSA